MQTNFSQLIQFNYNKIPLAVFLLGTNGSGKSSLRKLLNLSEITANIDPDILNTSFKNKYPKSYTFESAKEALTLFKHAISKGYNVCIESPLTGHGTISRIIEAKNAGFYTIAYYIGLETVELNIKRIQIRTNNGGHFIPDNIVRKRYPESLNNFIKIKNHLNSYYIIDNSSSNFKLVAINHDHNFNILDNSISWANQLIAQLIE